MEAVGISARFLFLAASGSSSCSSAVVVVFRPRTNFGSTLEKTGVEAAVKIHRTSHSDEGIVILEG